MSFAIVKETEAFETLDIIIASDAPVFVKAQNVDNFVNKFVSKSSPIIAALRILKVVDPLMYYSQADIQVFKSNNVVTPEAWTTHVYAYPTLMKLYDQDKTLFDKPDATIVNMVLAIIPKPDPGQLAQSIAMQLVNAPAPPAEIVKTILNE